MLIIRVQKGNPFLTYPLSKFGKVASTERGLSIMKIPEQQRIRRCYMTYGIISPLRVTENGALS